MIYGYQGVYLSRLISLEKGSREGIDMCNKEGEAGWHSIHYSID